MGGGEPTERYAPITAMSYENAYRTAIDAMNQIGRVQREDKDRGLIYGQSRSGVMLDVDLRHAQGKATDIYVKGSLPAGKFGVGSVTEPDDYLRIFTNLSQRNR